MTRAETEQGGDVDRALAGVRVIEVTHFELGKMCGQVLAWLGADVIRLEGPQNADPSREAGPHMFASLNTNKRAVTIDLKSSRGRDLFFDLLRAADVLIENMAPGNVRATRDRQGAP